MRYSRVSSFLLPWLALLILFAIWQSIVYILQIPKWLLPAPSDIFRTMYDIRAEILHFAPLTLEEAGLGFLIGNLAGLLIAIAFVHIKILERIFLKILIGFQNIPIIIFIPYLIIILGYGLWPNTVAGALGAIFPCAVSMSFALKMADEEGINLLNYSRVIGANQAQIFFKLRFPNSLPALFVTLKLTAVFCLIGVITGELLGGGKGLGYLLEIYLARQDRSALLAIAFVLIFIALAFFYTIGFIQKKTCPWLMEEKEG